MTSLEERCLEIEGVVFKIDWGENGSFYAQVILADPYIGITAKALDDVRSLHKGDECLCLNNKYILKFQNESRLEAEREFVLKSIENRFMDAERLYYLFYRNSAAAMAECAFK